MTWARWMDVRLVCLLADYVSGLGRYYTEHQVYQIAAVEITVEITRLFASILPQMRLDRGAE